MNPFSDATLVSEYAERTMRLVPGLSDMHRMSVLMLEECVPSDGHVLVVGAGGGLELKVFASGHPGWHLHGVDPSGEMLDLARKTLGPLLSQVDLHLGYVHTAQIGPFDAATCILTLHFLTREERLETLREIHRRLKPGGVFVVMHFSFDQEGDNRRLWLSRYAAFAASSGVDAAKAKAAAATIDQQLTILSPEQDERLLREAGFADIAVFYAGLAFRGWVARA